MGLHALKDDVDRRHHARREWGPSAVIRVHDGGDDVRCVLQDVSVGGACVRLETPGVLPPYFMLIVPAEHIELNCVLVWSDNERAGVSFR